MVYKPKKGEEGIGPRWFPNHVVTELSQAIFFLAIVVLLAGYFTKGLEAPADPFTTPQHIKPEWYFLALYQVLKLIPQQAFGIENFNKPFTLMATAVVVLVLILIPWIDRTSSESNHPLKRPLIFLFFTLGIVSFLALTIWGYYS